MLLNWYMWRWGSRPVAFIVLEAEIGEKGFWVCNSSIQQLLVNLTCFWCCLVYLIQYVTLYCPAKLHTNQVMADLMTIAANIWKRKVGMIYAVHGAQPGWVNSFGDLIIFLLYYQIKDWTGSGKQIKNQQADHVFINSFLNVLIKELFNILNSPWLKTALL